MNLRKTNRLGNFEILRLLSMLFIVVYHFFSHGLHSFVGEKIYFDTTDIIGIVNFFSTELFFNLVQIAVNVYVLLTGYFLIENSTFKLEKILKIWLQVFFYSVLLGSIFFLTTDKLSMGDMMKCFFPFKGNAYWFVTKYLALVALAPFIAIMVESISKAKYQLLLGIMCLLTLEIYKLPFACNFGNTYGNSLLFFVTLFLTGGYIRKYGSFNLFCMNEKAIFALVYIITFLWAIAKVLPSKNPTISGFPYHSMTFLEAVAFFQMFATFKCEGKFWNSLVKIAPYTFGVYLISDNNYVRMWLWDDIVCVEQNITSVVFVPYAILSSVAIMTVCMMIDAIRAKLFSLCRVDMLIYFVSSKLNIR